MLTTEIANLASAAFGDRPRIVLPNIENPQNAQDWIPPVTSVVRHPVTKLREAIRGADRLADEPRLRNYLPANARAVQCTLFAKTAESNWLVSLHQDLSMPVAERVESPACTGWSEKQGDTFVQPPISVLENVLAVRIHLDDCDARNGALCVVPGSHRLGRLSSDESARARDARGQHVVPVPKGGAMIMRPLLLHASSKSSVALPRRVLHFVYGPAALPEGLHWAPLSHGRSWPSA